MPPLSVLVVEDEPATAAHLAASVRSHDGLHMAAQAGSLAEGFDALGRLQPDVVLVDLGLPDGSGLPLIQAAARRDPPPDVMVVSVFGDEHNVLAAIEAGAGGYLLKDGTYEDVAGSILQLAAGEAPISPAIAAHLVRRLRPRASSSAAGPAGPVEPAGLLTQREMGVLELVAKGLSYDEIASALELRYNTVASYAKVIYRKLAVRSRGEAVFEARQMGLLQ
jgi:DNA-binding NarL/FixJ family response regulator